MGNNRFPILCGIEDCTGCSSCAQSCPSRAIEMRINTDGFYNPFVNQDKCIGCLLCEKSCPVISPISRNIKVPRSFATWNKDDAVRNDSSSGGVFTSIANVILNAGGTVWGAGFADNMSLTYQCVEKLEDLAHIRRSKYIQAFVGDCFNQIRDQLRSGRKVLFCGTPCHVAGLYAYLKGKNIDNLFTVDFICHGVPSAQLFHNYIDWLEKKYKDKIIDFNFREKRYGTNYNIGTSATFKNIGKKYLYLNDNSYTLGFCKDITIHRTCRNCNFRNTERNSDFTMGDFHAPKKSYSYLEQYKGISSLIVNSDKGESLLQSLDLTLKEYPIEQIIKSNPSYSKNWDLRFDNQKLLIEDSYDQVQSRLFVPTLRDKLKTLAMLVLGGKFIYFLKCKI